MRERIREKRGSVSVEAALVTSVFLLLILMMLTALLNEYVRVTAYCGTFEEEARLYAQDRQGTVLRLLKVITDTGTDLIHGLSQTE